jgi:hypothetical protein
LEKAVKKQFAAEDSRRLEGIASSYNPGNIGIAVACIWAPPKAAFIKAPYRALSR